LTPIVDKPQETLRLCASEGKVIINIDKNFPDGANFTALTKRQGSFLDD